MAKLGRDFRTGEVHPIDCNLLDLVHTLGRVVGGGKPVQLISAYRSPKTNAKLAAKSSGVAKRSLNMQGKAFDIRIPDVSARDIYKAAIALKGGGAGLYARSNFVHVDTGRVRRWVASAGSRLFRAARSRWFSRLIARVTSGLAQAPSGGASPNRT